MKFSKTIKFDLYALGDRPMEGVMFNVDLAISDDDKVLCIKAEPDELALSYLKRIGGDGAPNYWKEKVLKHFSTESNVREELGENMTEEEFDQWEPILMGEN